jgi:hypothetical protein
VSRIEAVHLVVISVVGGLAGFWGLLTNQAMYVAGGVPLFLSGALFYRVVRLERLVEELRTQRTETR